MLIFAWKKKHIENSHSRVFVKIDILIKRNVRDVEVSKVAAILIQAPMS